MKKMSLLVMLLFVMSFCTQVFAQGLPQTSKHETVAEKNSKEKKAPPKKFSVECSGGSLTVPGFMLNGSLVKHPDKLSGNTFGCGLSLHIGKSRRWSIGPKFSRIAVSGSGEWAEPDTQARLDSEGVDGVAKGKLNINITTVAFVARKEFSAGVFRPYLEFGGGVGFLKSDFRGRFEGHETMSGYDFPVNEPATDRSKRMIPVFVFKPGISLAKERVNLSFGPQWNTIGWGFEGSFRFRFGH